MPRDVFVKSFFWEIRALRFQEVAILPKVIPLVSLQKLAHWLPLFYRLHSCCSRDPKSPNPLTWVIEMLPSSQKGMKEDLDKETGEMSKRDVMKNKWKLQNYKKGKERKFKGLEKKNTREWESGPKKDIHKDKLAVILGALRRVWAAAKIAFDLNGE